MIYWELFWSFVQIGAFSFGGGLAAMPLIREQVVTLHGWLSLASFTDLVTISEMTPGPIAINAATFVGLQTAGLPGALVATLGSILPACIVVTLLAGLYQKYGNLTYVKGVLSGLRPAVVALIASAGVSILLLALWDGGAASWSGVNWIAAGLFLAAFFVLRRWKPNPIFVMLGCGLLGGVLYLCF